MKASTLHSIAAASALALIVLFPKGPALADGCPAPSFAAPVIYDAGWNPWSVAAADYNSDGKPDLAVTAADGVSILLGNGDGTFQGAIHYGGKSFSVVVGDFNGDDKLDLAVAPFNYYPFPQDSVSILRGNGDGTFKPSGNSRAGSLPHALAVGHFNGDGRLDLAVANYGSYDWASGGYTNGDVSVLLGKGDATFQPAVNYSVGENLTSVEVGDFNADGKPDLAVANPNANSVSILLANGDGTFQSAANYGAGTDPLGVALGDFNIDGKDDLAVACYGSWDPISATYTNSGVWVLLGKGDGTFETTANYGEGESAYSVAVGEFNGDGKLDLTLPGDVLLGNGDGTFQPAVSYGEGGVSAVVADFNGDGKFDLAVAVSGGGFLNPTKGHVYVSLNTCGSTGVHLDVEGKGTTLVLSWPLSSGASVLESATGFNSSHWQPISGMLTTNNGRCEVTVSLDQAQRYFRLRKQ